MGLHFADEKLVIITAPEAIHFDLPKEAGKNWKHEIDYIIRHTEFIG